MGVALLRSPTAAEDPAEPETADRAAVGERTTRNGVNGAQSAVGAGRADGSVGDDLSVLMALQGLTVTPVLRHARRPSRKRLFAPAAGAARRLALALWLGIVGYVATPSRLRRRLATLDVSQLAGSAPRLVPHALVLAVALVAITVGGFARPEPTFVIGLDTESGGLTAHSRYLLGPRAADVVVPDSLRRPPSMTTLSPNRPRAEVITYTVSPGDTPWDIGARFNVGAYSVLWSNGLDEDDIIKPGQELRIPPVVGALHVVAEGDTLDTITQKYSVDPAAIVDYNGLRPGDELAIDKLLVVPGGSLPIKPKPVAPPPPPRPAPPAPAPPVARPAAPPLIRRPAPPPPPPAAPTGRLSWPTRGVITTYYSGWHPGIDIAAAGGTPIGAADGGAVTFAGWDSTGYGYRVVVSHGNGYSTTYNHLSVISVRPGQGVGKGQTIGRMGSTGRSTGPHLHFEVVRNGVFVNPLGILS